MRYLVMCVLVGLPAWPQSVAAQAGEEVPANSGLAIHVQRHLPPQLMLRASYFYLPEHLEQRRPGHKHKEIVKEPVSEPALKLEGDSAGVGVTPTEQTSQPKKGLSKGGKIAIGVVVPLVVGAAIGAGIWAATFDLGWE